jgi:hypothetical protein
MTLNGFAKSFMRDETLFQALSDYIRRGIQQDPQFLEEVKRKVLNTRFARRTKKLPV